MHLKDLSPGQIVKITNGSETVSAVIIRQDSYGGKFDTLIGWRMFDAPFLQHCATSNCGSPSMQKELEQYWCQKYLWLIDTTSSDSVCEYSLVVEDEECPSTKPASQIKNEEVPQWKLFRDVNRPIDICPCGINRHQCGYH
jgi:hypothetical protein